jgi:beta-glucanase (GH16 family)
MPVIRYTDYLGVTRNRLPTSPTALHSPRTGSREIDGGPGNPVLFADDFNRPDQALNANGNWINASAGTPMSIIGGQLVGGTTASPAFRWAAPTASDDQFSEVQWLGGSFNGPNVQMSSYAANAGASTVPPFYVFRWNSATNVGLGYKTAGSSTYTALTSATYTLTPGDLMRLEYVGGILRCYVNDVLLITHDPVALRITGQRHVGIGVNTGSASGLTLFDNWRGGDAAAYVPAVLPTAYVATTSDAAPAADTASAAVTPATPPSTVVFFDDFTGPAGTAPSAASWSYDIGDLGVNNELQTYTSSAANVATDGAGNLAIVARSDGAGGYTSGRIHAIGKVAQQFGRIEARIKVPKGTGLWPAFWAMSDPAVYGAWPRNGEIDILESVNAMLTDTTSLHGPMTAAPGTPWHLNRTWTPGLDLSADFHVYAVEWQTNLIAFYLDGGLAHVLTPADMPAGATWPFNDKPFSPILNLAVGGDFPGQTVDPAALPATMLVDYVRITTPPTGGFTAARPKVSTLVTAFTDQREFEGWWAAAALAGGALVLQVNNQYGGILRSERRFDLTSSQMSAQLVAPPNVGAGTTETQFQALANPSNYVDFGWVNGTLYCREVVNGASDATYPGYTPAQDKFLRMRHDGTNLIWETSPDGVTGWVTRRSKVPVVPLTNLGVQLVAGYYGTETAPGTATWDDLNTTAAAPAQLARAAADTASAADATTRATTRTRATGDAAAAADQLTRAATRARATLDTAPAADTVATSAVPALAQLTRSTTDTAAASDALTAARDAARATVDTATAADTATAEVTPAATGPAITAGNGFEGLADGTTITPANSGGASGTAFDAATIPSSGQTIAVSAARAAHGTRSLQIGTGATATTSNLSWMAAVGARTTFYLRWYAYFTALPASSSTLWRGLLGGTTGMGINLSSAGALRAQDAAGASSTATTVPGSIPLNQWFRVEARVVAGTGGTGTIEIRRYDTADAPVGSPSASITATGLTLTASFDTYRFGLMTSLANWGPVWIDDLGVNLTDWCGPAVATGPPGPVTVDADITDLAPAADTTAAAVTTARAAADTAPAADTTAAAVTRVLAATVADPAPAVDAATRVTTRARAATDATGGADSVAAASARVRAVSDSAAGSDALVASSGRTRAAGDTAPAVDQLTRAETRARAAVDTAAAADQLTRARAGARAVTDAAAAGDALTTRSARARTLTDAAGAGDTTASSSAHVLTAAAADTAPAADTTTARAARVRAAADTAAAADTTTRGTTRARAAGDTAPAADSATRGAAAARPTTDTAPTVDTLTTRATRARALTDTAPAGDITAAGAAHQLAATTTDTAAAVDQLARTVARTRTAGDTAPTVDTTARAGSRARASIDAAPAADAAAQTSTHVLARAASDTAAAVDQPARATSSARAAADTAPAGDQTARATTRARAVGDTAPAADTTAQTSAHVLTRATSDAAAAADATARATSRARAVTDVSAVTDTPTRATTRGRATLDAAAAADQLAVAVAQALAAAAADTAPATDVTSRRVMRARTPTDTAPAVDVTTRATTAGSLVTDAAPLADLVTRAAATARAQLDTALAVDLAGAVVEVYVPPVFIVTRPGLTVTARAGGLTVTARAGGLQLVGNGAGLVIEQPAAGLAVTGHRTDAGMVPADA